MKKNRKISSANKIIIFLIVLILATILIGRFAPGVELSTSTLKTSLNRLSSTFVNINIPEPGKLNISAGPSSYLGDANVFALEIISTEAFPEGNPPFTPAGGYTPIFNAKNANDPRKLILAVVFPKDHFTYSEEQIAELNFRTYTEGQFEILNIYFGNLPTAGFPPFQEYPIFITSSNIPFDENGAAKYVSTSFVPPPPPPPKCSDQIDNDGDEKIDYPEDPGCENPLENDETDPPGPASITLAIPSEYLMVIRKPDLSTEYLAILPPAQEQLQYEYHLSAKGGLEPKQYIWGVRGSDPNSSGVYPLENSGLAFSSKGVLTGSQGSLKAGNYRYQFTVSDGAQSINFGAQIAVYDAFGNPIGLIMESSIDSGEHQCKVNQLCEAFFRASKGIAPYLYSFSGESPLGDRFLQANAGETFYRLVCQVMGTWQNQGN